MEKIMTADNFILKIVREFEEYYDLNEELEINEDQIPNEYIRDEMDVCNLNSKNPNSIMMVRAFVQKRLDNYNKYLKESGGGEPSVNLLRLTFDNIENLRIEVLANLLNDLDVSGEPKNKRNVLTLMNTEELNEVCFKNDLNAKSLIKSKLYDEETPSKISKELETGKEKAYLLIAKDLYAVKTFSDEIENIVMPIDFMTKTLSKSN
jgi:hypothetical protein